MEVGGPKAPKDPEMQGSSFYIMRNKEIAGAPQPDGRGIQFLYLDGGRLEGSARMVGGISDEKMLAMLDSAEDFRKLVRGIGVRVETGNMRLSGSAQMVNFVFQMYGKTDPYHSGTVYSMQVCTDGVEQFLNLDAYEWSEDNDRPGQIRFEFKAPEEYEIEGDSCKWGGQINSNHLAKVSVRFFLRDGFEAPEMPPEEEPDFDSIYYQNMLEKSLMQTGNTGKLKAAIEKARRGEDVTIAFIGGSITQGAGAVPIHTGCYAYRTFEGLCALAGKRTDENLHYIKAGVGGTPSELGMLRYERDVLRDGQVAPDIVVVEFAVNDEGDETKGECYDALVRKALCAPNEPVVILLFAVFANDWNLQERLSPVGRAYGLPMVSVKDCVVEQFYKKPGEGRVVSKAQFFYDSLHPSNIGHKIMADALVHLFKTADRMPIEAPGKGAEMSIGVSIAKNKSAAMPQELRLALRENPCEFQNVKLLDRKTAILRSDHTVGVEYEPKLKKKFDFEDGPENKPERKPENEPENESELSGCAVISCGSFSETDTDLQAVEMDCNLTPTPQFPYNWSHQGNKNKKADTKDTDFGITYEGSNEPFRMTITCTALLLIYKDSGSAQAGCAKVYVDHELVLTADPRVNGWTHCNPVICFRGRERKAYQVEIRMCPGDEEKDFTILGFGYVE